MYAAKPPGMSLLRLLLIFLSISCLCACSQKRTLFKKITSSHSGISFNNTIVENDTINPFDVVNIYNGGGDQLLLDLQGDNTNGYTSTINIGLDLTDIEVGASDSAGGPGGGPPP